MDLFERNAELDKRLKGLEESHRDMGLLLRLERPLNDEELRIFNELAGEAKNRGMYLATVGSSIHISLNDYYYIKRMNRLAGRKAAVSGNTISHDFGGSTYDFHYKYSDVAELLDNGTMDKDIMEIIGMKPATYFRHKKKMMESEFMEIYRKNAPEGYADYDEYF